MLDHLVILAFFLIFVTISLGQDCPVTETSLGKIKGHYKRSYGGRRFAAYEGIPYAKPPVGDLRFEEPIQAEPWTGILNATMVHTCFQWFIPTNEPIGNEDCLYLNVYVPENENIVKSKLDVIVHIHGGAFMMSDPQLAGPEYLMDRNIIYVNFNYRLGALGFLSTEDEVAPGNNGMRDQIMALKWIQNHIERFGGNPNSVTLTGLSAGGGSVHLHYFSPLSKGLFHRGISQSGTALAPWVINRAALKQAKCLAASIGCDNLDTRGLVKCLKKRSAREVIQNSYCNSPITGFPLSPFSPVIDGRWSSNAFLPECPFILLNSGNITDLPWLAGATADEGILGLGLLNFKYDDLNRRWDAVLPYVLKYYDTVKKEDEAVVAEEIKKFYFNNKEVTEDNVQSFIKLFGDRYSYLDLQKSVQRQAKVVKSPVYTYIYGYSEEAKPNKLFSKEKSYGVTHGSDAHLLYSMKFLGVSYIEGKLSEDDKIIKEFLLDVYTSFAKDGKPLSNGITWEPVENGKDLKYLCIEKDEIKMSYKNELAPEEFWTSLPLQEYDNYFLKHG